MRRIRRSNPTRKFRRARMVQMDGGASFESVECSFTPMARMTRQVLAQSRQSERDCQDARTGAGGSPGRRQMERRDLSSVEDDASIDVGRQIRIV